jgi:hypothetical protein
MKEQILRKMIRESVKRMISESTLKEAEQTVKSEAISRLADFFRVPAHTLDKFNFDGNDDIKSLSSALNSMSDQGTKMYYDMAIQLAKKDLGVEESVVTEASMSDIDIMAQEAKDFKSFVKEFIKTHHDLSNAGEPGQFKDWLQSIYDNAKANMDESVVNEADMTRQYDGFIVLDQKTKKNYKFNYIKGVDNVKAENNAIAKLMQQTSSPRGNFMVNGLIKKGEFTKANAEVSEQQSDNNAMKTKIREAGGRRFAKTESIRQHNMSKIKEANKKK